MNSRIQGHADARFASPVPEVRGGGRTRTVATPDAPRRRPLVSTRSPATPLPFLRLDLEPSFINMAALTITPGTPPTPDSRRVVPVVAAIIQRQHEDNGSDDENDQDRIPSPPRNVRVHINLVNARARRGLNFENVTD